MPKYEESGFNPPAPIVRARVRGPGPEIEDDVPLLLDSGADISVVPRAAAQAVGATIEPGVLPVQFLTGEASAYEQATLAIEFGGYRFRGSFMVLDAEYGVLGRNILNLLVVTLDGPRRTWTA